MTIMLPVDGRLIEVVVEVDGITPDGLPGLSGYIVRGLTAAELVESERIETMINA